MNLGQRIENGWNQQRKPAGDSHAYSDKFLGLVVLSRKIVQHTQVVVDINQLLPGAIYTGILLQGHLQGLGKLFQGQFELSPSAMKNTQQDPTGNFLVHFVGGR